MKLKWIIENKDIRQVKTFFDENKSYPNVKVRTKVNLKSHLVKFSKSSFWLSMVTCLLTTQQRWQRVDKFVKQNPFPLDYLAIKNQKDLRKYVQKQIADFGGLRRANLISEEIFENFIWLENDGWAKVKNEIELLKKLPNKIQERKVSKFIYDNLKGFGPKQARNLLQDLGLTKYEIPIDSRIMKWLNKFGFPIHLNASGLSDENYYNFVLDGFQELCEKANIYPCLLDAAIFSSFDKRKENV